MSTARSVLLEVRRRLGDVHAATPGETDLMAFLNKALSGIWNYGVRLRSPVLQRVQRFTEATGDTVEFDSGAPVVLDVYDHSTGRRLCPVREGRLLEDSLDATQRRYRVVNDTLTLLPATNAGFDLTVCFIPQFAPLDARDDDLPFPSMLDGVVVEWTVTLLLRRTQTVSDVEPGLLGHGNTLSEYFRGATPRLVTGAGPW
jgi:hypothetical protein